MPQSPCRPSKFRTYWAAVSASAYQEYPQVPWELLRPDEASCFLEVRLRGTRPAVVSRTVGTSRAAVTQATHRADVKLEDLDLDAPPIPRLTVLPAVTGRAYFARRDGSVIADEPEHESIERIMCGDHGHDEGFGFVGWGTFSREKWTRHRQASKRQAPTPEGFHETGDRGDGGMVWEPEDAATNAWLREHGEPLV